MKPKEEEVLESENASFYTHKLYAPAMPNNHIDIQVQKNHNYNKTFEHTYFQGM